MRFTLEALQANHGDSLLIHWGTATAPGFMLIDGGPDPTYRTTLRARLTNLAASRPAGRLDIDLLMISHIDDDHIEGIQRLLTDVVGGRLPQIRVANLWFNSFDDLALDGGFVAAAVNSTVRLAAVRRQVRRAGRGAGSVKTSVAQGNKVAQLAAQFGLQGNPPFAGLVMSPKRSARTVPVGDGLKLTVLGPNEGRVDSLRKQWQAAAAAGHPGSAMLADLDDSVANLSSIVVLARAAGKSMLLTGDARSDDIVAGLRTARLLNADGGVHVDLLKVPHHGSDRNVDTDFFRTVTAEHYVFSGDGAENNPELATLAMLTEARRRARFTIHLTNRERRIERWFARNREAADRYDVRYRRANSPSIVVDLADRG